MVQHDAGLRMCPRFQGGLKFLSRRRLDTCGEIAMRRKIQPLKFLSNEFLTNTSAVIGAPQQHSVWGLGLGYVTFLVDTVANCSTVL